MDCNFVGDHEGILGCLFLLNIYEDYAVFMQIINLKLMVLSHIISISH
jgi:hypothetical protein